MAASFPTSVAKLANNNDYTGNVATQINALNDEIEAVETALKGTLAAGKISTTELTIGSTVVSATGVEINNHCDLDTLQAMTADGAITIKNGIVTLDKAGALAATLAAPAAGDNGKMLTIYSLTAQAHTVTIAGSPASTSDDVATWTNQIGNSLTLRAYGQKWYVVGAMGVDVA